MVYLWYKYKAYASYEERRWQVKRKGDSRLVMASILCMDIEGPKTQMGNDGSDLKGLCFICIYVHSKWAHDGSDP